MVLGDLGDSLSLAVKQLRNATIIDEKVLKDCLNAISNALLQADIEPNLVRTVQTNLMKIVNLGDLKAGKINCEKIQLAIFDELCTLLDSAKPSFTPIRRRTSIVMFVGLQGSGKTTTCTKYAQYYKSRRWKPALICADTFRDGAFEQLKESGTEACIPVYGSCTESDPVRTAEGGVRKFKKEKYDLIIVDTSGSHKQEDAKEIWNIYEAIRPKLVVLVIDGSIGQAAGDQVTTFQGVPVGAVIITKMDGHAKAGGALSAVVATKRPVIFIRTGKHIHEYTVEPFVSRLLGMQDLFESIDKLVPLATLDEQPEFHDMISEEKYSLRMMIHQLRNVLVGIGQVDENHEMKTYIAMAAVMSSEELDSSEPDKLFDEYRMMQVAKSSGCQVGDVKDMLELYERISTKTQDLLKNEPKVIINTEHIDKKIGKRLVKTGWHGKLNEANGSQDEESTQLDSSEPDKLFDEYRMMQLPESSDCQGGDGKDMLEMYERIFTKTQDLLKNEPKVIINTEHINKIGTRLVETGWPGKLNEANGSQDEESTSKFVVRS